MADDKMPMGGWDDERAETELVSEDRCINCKHHRDDWVVGEGAVLDTGEVICDTCLADLRRWKRSRTFMLLLHDEFDPDGEVSAVFLKHYDNLVEELTERFGAGMDVTDHGEAIRNATSE